MSVANVPSRTYFTYRVLRKRSISLDSIETLILKTHKRIIQKVYLIFFLHYSPLSDVNLSTYVYYCLAFSEKFINVSFSERILGRSR